MFALLMVILMILLLISLPITFTLTATGIIGLIIQSGFAIHLVSVPKIMYDSLDGEFILVAIPLFILMSVIMSKGKIGEYIFSFASAWLGNLPAGLAVATILSAAFFSAISGSSITVAATVGTVAIPELLKRGYPKKFCIGLVVAGGTMGIIIPPSIPMIVYGSITGASVGKLFAAGIIPGLIITVIFTVYSIIYSYHHRLHIKTSISWPDRWNISIKALPAFMLPIFIIGSIYTGIATPTESAALGVVASLFISCVIYKTIKFNELVPVLKNILLEANTLTGSILIIISGAMVFGFVVTSMGLPQIIASYVDNAQMGVPIFILAISILLFIMGGFLDVLSIMLITLPVLLPTLAWLNIDLIWFAVLVVINMELAAITPPVGMNLFVIKGVLDKLEVPTQQLEIISSTVPFLFLLILALVLVAIFPDLATLLPSLR